MKRTHIALVAGLFGLVLFTSGCGASSNSTSPSNGAELKVAGTIFPVYDLVRTVGGEHVDTKLILPSGTSPHVYEPTAKTLKDLQGTEIVFAIGQELDTWADDIIKNIDSAKKVTLDHHVKLMAHAENTHDDHEEEEHHDEDEHEDEHEDEDHDGHNHGEFDPHYWLSPANAIEMVEEITEVLSERSPEHADAFEDNAKQFIKELEAENKKWENSIQKLANKNIVTFHGAFGYFANHFGLDVIATFEEFPGKEPTPKYLANLQEEIQEHNIQSLYLEPQLSKASLESFAKDNKVRLGVLDPLGGVEGRMTYIELINYNVSTVLNTN